MEQQIFSDGIARISIIGGVVRLDMVTYSATEADIKGQPRAVLTHRVSMGVEAFLRSSEKVVEAVQMITRAQAGQPQAVSPALKLEPVAAAPPPRAETPPPVETPPPATEPTSPWTPPPPRRPFP